MKKIYVLAFFVVCFCTNLIATTYTSSQNGDWLNFTTWSPIGIPIPGDVVIINHTVTLDTSLAYTTGSITINTSGSLVQDSPVRDIWVNGVNASFTNNGYVDIRYLLLSAGSFTNSGSFNVKSLANYTTADNLASGVFNGLDSMYNDGTLNNSGTINVVSFFNNDVMNNYGNIWGITTIVDSMYNAGTFLNDVGAKLYADSCTNVNAFTNNGVINYGQFTNTGTFTNNNYLSFGDMTNTGIFTNQDSIIGGGSVTNTGTLNNQVGAFIDLAISFLNADTVNNNASFTANGRMEVGDSFYNFDVINGSAPGSIQCADSSYNEGVMSGTFDFCDLTPPASSPFIDFNLGTVSGTVTFCTVTGIDEITSSAVVVYPNPTSGILNVESDEVMTVEVFNLLGKIVLTTKQRQIDLRNYKNGIYLLKVKDLKGNTVRQDRIIKQ